jgi:hypothetical protein
MTSQIRPCTILLLLGASACIASGARAATNKTVRSNQYTQVETTIAISQIDNKVITIGHIDNTPRNGSNQNCGYEHTIDGGGTWTNKSFLKGVTIGNGGIYERGADPVMAYSLKHDTFHFICLGFDSDWGKSAIVYSSSSDKGATWSTPQVIVSSSSSSSPVDKPAIAIDSSSTGTYYGRVYAAWTRASSSHPKSVYVSYLNGTAWSAPKKVSAGYYGDYGPSIAVGGMDGTVYVAWCQNVTEENCDDERTSFIYFVKSSDGGATWTAPAVAALLVAGPHTLPGNNFEMHYFPSLSVNPTNGIVHLVYTSWARNYTDVDVLYTKSEDSGQSWSAPVYVNSHLADDQFFPWISTSPSGTTLWVCYYDQAWNASNDLDFSCSKSTDGIVFESAVRASNVSSTPGNWIGDYVGSAVTNGGNWRAVWADFRTAGNAGDIEFGKP